MKKSESWIIAYRKRDGRKTLIDDAESLFLTIPNSWRYWRGDPFLFEHSGKTFIFSELYDRILRRGVIGFCELKNDGASPWKIVLREPFHLSYPQVFSYGRDIFMIPESYVPEEIRLYKAVSFPEKWIYVKTLERERVVDSTIITFRGKKYLLAQRILDRGEQLVIFDIADRLELSHMRNAAPLNDKNSRPAGLPFQSGDKLYRPSQDCTESYGFALNINEVVAVDEGCFKEHNVCKFQPSDISIDCPVQVSGLHTYNLSDKWEVVDLKFYERDYFYPLMRIIWGVYRRITSLIKREK